MTSLRACVKKPFGVITRRCVGLLALALVCIVSTY